MESGFKQRLLAGGLWVVGGKAVAVLSGLVGNAVLTRLLPPDEIGAYFLTVSIVSSLAVLAQLGLAQASVRLIGESIGTDRPGRAASTVRLALVYGAVGAVVVAGIVATGIGSWLVDSLFHSRLIAGATGLIALWTIVAAMGALFAESFRGLHDLRYATLFEGTLTTILSTLAFAVLWLVQGHSEFGQVVVLSVLAGFTSSVVAGLLMRGKLKSISGKARLSTRELFHTAWPLLGVNLTAFVLLHADLWILGVFRPPEEVAIYGAALRLVKAVVFPLTIASAVVSAHIATMYAQGKTAELERLMRASATIVFVPAVVIAAAFIGFGGPVMALVFGEFYRSGAFILLLLSGAQLINAWTGSCVLALTMTGHQVAMMVIAVVAGIVAVTSSLLLVSRYGAVGVAVAATVGITGRNVASWIYARRVTTMWSHVDFAAIPRLRATLRDLWD